MSYELSCDDELAIVTAFAGSRKRGPYDLTDDQKTWIIKRLRMWEAAPDTPDIAIDKAIPLKTCLRDGQRLGLLQDTTDKLYYECIRAFVRSFLAARSRLNDDDATHDVVFDPSGCA